MIAGTLEIQMLANMARLADDMNKAKGMVGGAMKDIQRSVDLAKTALEGLAAGISVGMFVQMVKGSIDAADRLGDLSKASNISIRDMAGLNLLAKQTGTDLDGLAKGINKMSVEMGQAPEKFRALGITAKGSKEAFMQFADIFSNIADINQRNALSNAVFGKSWAELAPVLSEGGAKIGEIIEKGSRLSGMNEEMAAQADAYNDQMAELNITLGATTTKLVGDLLPQMNKIAEAMRTAAEEGGLFKAVLVGIGGVMTGIFTDDLLSREQQIIKQLNALRQEQGFALSGKGNLLNPVGMWRGRDSALNARNEEMLKLQLELQQIQDAKPKPPAAPDPEAQKAAAAAAAEFLEFEKREAERKRLLEERAKAEKKAEEEAIRALQNYMKVIGDETVSLMEKAKASEQENEVIGKTAFQIAAIEAARYDATIAQKAEQIAMIESIKGREGEVFMLKEQVKALKSLRDSRERKYELTAIVEANEKAAKEAAKEWERFTENVQRNLGDVLYSSMNGTFTNIGDLFEKMLLRMAADAAAAKITNSLFGGVGSGSSGSSGGANGAAAGEAASGAAAGAAIGKALPYVAAAYIFAKYGLGMGNGIENVGGNRLVGQFSRAGFTGNRQQDWEIKGGWFTQGHKGTVYSDITSAEGRAFKSMVDGLQKTFDTLGDTVGYAATRTKAWTVNVNQAGDVTGTLANGMGEQLVPSLVQLSEAGENLAQTAQRVTTAFNSTNYFINAIGLSSVSAFGSLGIASAAARLKLIEAAGGLETFNRNASFFVSNFLDDAQKLAPSLASVGRTFAQLGISGIDTNKAFAERVALETQLGNYDTVAKLLGVAEAFNAITASAKLAADQLKEVNFKSMVDYKRAKAYAMNGGVAGQIAEATARAAAGFPAEEEANARQARIDAKKNAYEAMVQALYNAQHAGLPFHFIQQPDGSWLEEREVIYRQKKAFYESLPAFAKGSAYIPYDMTANIHQGEMVVDAQSANVLRKYGMASGNDALVAEIRALRDEVTRLRASSESTANSTRKTSDLLRNVTQDGNSLLTTPA